MSWTKKRLIESSKKHTKRKKIHSLKEGQKNQNEKKIGLALAQQLFQQV